MSRKKKAKQYAPVEYYKDRKKLNNMAETMAGQNPVVISRMNHGGKVVSTTIGFRWWRLHNNPEILKNIVIFRYSYNLPIIITLFANTRTGVIQAYAFGLRYGHNIYFPVTGE